MTSPVPTPLGDAVQAAYRRGEDDEAMEPLVLVDGADQPIGRIKDGDHVIFYDIRGEREVELTLAFVDPRFTHFSIEPMTVPFTTMIEYRSDLPVSVAFPPPGRLDDTLAHVVSRAGLRQARIAESEKAIHITYFFSGKCEKPLPGEEREEVPSPRDVPFDTVPQMNAEGVADAVIRRLKEPELAFITANLANVDVVGHLENREAIGTAVAAVDAAAGRIIKSARAAGVTTLVTADHGTVESWLYPDGSIDTGHTKSQVPFVLVPPEGAPAGIALRDSGELADVAPTAAALLDLETPPSWTGRPLLADTTALSPGRVLILILDGWGEGDGGDGDLIASASTPVMDRLRSVYPSTTLRAAGESVGMPSKAVGNSEVGHLHLGAGRRIPSDRVRIDTALADGSFLENPAFLNAVRASRDAGTALHLLGIISFYSSHGSVRHLEALLELAARERHPEVYVHGMLGRRGERPEAGAGYVRDVEQECARLGVGRVTTMIGRFWSLDREENWDRIEKTYDALVRGVARHVPDDSKE